MMTTVARPARGEVLPLNRWTALAACLAHASTAAARAHAFASFGATREEFERASIHWLARLAAESAQPRSERANSFRRGAKTLPDGVVG
jgi:hypothetical protein